MFDYICYSGFMDTLNAIAILSALAQTTRLDTFRLLISREPEGMNAGDLARYMAVPQNTMSAHLAVLSRAGLVEAERRSRSMIYRARPAALSALVVFLLQECCGGHPELCQPVMSALSSCNVRSCAHA